MITLLTDFGTSDPYVGIMKGAILSVDPLAGQSNISWPGYFCTGCRSFKHRIARRLPVAGSYGRQIDSSGFTETVWVKKQRNQRTGHPYRPVWQSDYQY